MEGVQREVDRILTLLRAKIRERGLTQLEIQKRLGWGRAYLSQLFTKQKALRVEQLLLVLGAIGLESAHFFAELYRWPLSAPLPVRREPGEPGEDLETRVKREVGEILQHLRTRTRAGGMTQLQVQDRAGWGRSYLSLLFSQRKSLRFDQVLTVLWAIGVSAPEFFADLYLPPEDRPAVRPPPEVDLAEEVARLAEEVEDTRAVVRELVRVLVEKGVVGPEDLRGLGGR